MYVDMYKYVGTVVSVMYISTYSTSAFITYIMHKNLVGLRMHRKHLVTNSTLQSSSHNHYNNIMRPALSKPATYAHCTKEQFSLLMDSPINRLTTY